MENYELLSQLYAIHSPSRSEKKMRKFIKDYIKRNIPQVELSYDKVGNIYAKKGTSGSFPCVVSHIDQVQHEHGRDFRSYVVDGKVFGFSPSVMKMRGLGADDKNGIWVCLQVLAKYDIMKCAFFVGEEIGCVGSSDADMTFFDDCRYVLQCDRRNGGDLITSVWGDLCSTEFLNDTDYKDFGYKECDGLSTDVATLKDNGLKVSCVNMSCGYYNPHTDEEYTKLSELENCLAFVEHIIEKCVKVYPHEQTKFAGYGGFDWDDDPWTPHYGGVYGGYKHYDSHKPYGSAGSSYGASAYKGGEYVWSHEKGHYVWKDFEKEDDVDDQATLAEEQELDDINYEIYDCLSNGMSEEDTITDIQYFFPHYSSDVLRIMIDDVRSAFPSLNGAEGERRFS